MAMTSEALLGRPCIACDAAALPRDVVLCPACRVPLPPHPQASPFEALGLLPPRYAVDGGVAEKAWLARSRQIHPDRFATKAPAVKRAAAEQMAALNDAWRTLKSPFERAHWLLKAVAVDEPKLPQQWLFALMEAREAAEEGADAKARVVADHEARFAEVQQRADTIGATLDAADVWSLSEAERAAHLPNLRRLGLALAEQRTLARLVADLGGASLLPSLTER